MSKNVIRTTGQFSPTPVEDNIKLWHVMESCKLSTFLDGGLWLARLDQFGTNYEEEVPVANIGLLKMLLGNQSHEVQVKYEAFAQNAYASCWHMNNDDPSDEMWNDFNGEVAIRTQPSIMQKVVSSVPASKNGGPAYFSKVSYINYSGDMISDRNMIYASFAVADNYQDVEQEARVLICVDAIPLNHKVYDYMRNGGEAIVLPVKPESFIEEIVIRGSLSNIQSDQIRRDIQSKKLGHKIRTN